MAGRARDDNDRDRADVVRAVLRRTGGGLTTRTLRAVLVANNIAPGPNFSTTLSRMRGVHAKRTNGAHRKWYPDA